MNALVISTGGQRWGAGLDRAAQLLANQTGIVTLVHIIPRTPYYGRGLPVWDEWDDPWAESAVSAALLHEGAHHLTEHCPGLTIRTRREIGEPRDVILRLAAETGADVLILDGRLQDSCSLDAPPQHAQATYGAIPQAPLAQRSPVAAGT